MASSAPAALAARSTTRVAYAPSVTSQSDFRVVPTRTASQPISSAASSNLVRNGQRYSGGMVLMSFARTYRAARTGRPMAPQHECRTTRARVTHTCPYTQAWAAGPGVGLRCTPAPSTHGPYRLVTVSSRANTTRPLGPPATRSTAPSRTAPSEPTRRPTDPSTS